MNPIDILLVDDHLLFREGLKSLLELMEEMHIVGEAGDGEEAIAMARELMPDVILMDIRLPGMSGVEATRIIKNEMPTVEIVMLTASEDDAHLFDSLKAGAQGYVLKNVASQELAKLIHGVLAGEAAISGVMASKILAELNKNETKEERELSGTELTKREIEVLKLIGEGFSNRQISGKLFVTESTVKKHVRNILQKLHLQNRVQVALYAVDQGLVNDSHDV